MGEQTKMKQLRAGEGVVIRRKYLNDGEASNFLHILINKPITFFSPNWM